MHLFRNSVAKLDNTCSFIGLHIVTRMVFYRPSVALHFFIDYLSLIYRRRVTTPSLPFVNKETDTH